MHLRKLLLFLIVLPVVSVYNVHIVHGAEAHPALSATQFLFFNPPEQNITVVFPQTLTARYTPEVDHKVNVRWFRPFDDPASYRYEVLSVTWSFVTKPRELYDHPTFGRYLMTYLVSVSAVPRAEKAWGLHIDEYVKVFIYVTIYVRIERPPRWPFALKLEDLVGNDSIPIAYSAVVKRVHPDEETWNVTGTVELLTYPWLAFYKLEFMGANVSINRYGGFGEFEKDRFIAIGPIGNIRIKLCIDDPFNVPPGMPPYELEGYLIYRSELQEVEVPFKLSTEWSPPCGEYTIPNVLLIPGNYTNATPLVVTMKTSMIETAFHIKGVVVNGTLVAVLSPFVIASVEEFGNAYRWVVTAMAPVVVYEYNSYHFGRVWLSGTVRINGTPISMYCPEQSFFESGVFRCRTVSQTPPYQPGNIYTGTANLEIGIRAAPDFYFHSDTVSTDVIMVTHASLQYIVLTMMGYTRIAVTISLVAWSVYFVLSYFFGIFRAPSREEGGVFFFHIDPVNMLMYLALIVTFLHLLPLLYHEVARIACMFPESRFRQAIGCPIHLRNLLPEEAVSYLFSFYDRLIVNIKQDYVTWVRSQIDALSTRLLELSILVGVLIGLALLLMPSMNAPVAGSLVASILGFIFVVIPFILSLTQVVGLILVYISLAEIILSVVVVLMMISFIVGVVLVAFDSPYTRRFGEMTLGASFFFFLLSPIVALMVYGIYEYTKYTLEKELIEEISRRIPVLSIPLARGFVPPLDIVARISGFVALSTISLSIVIFANAFILSRTGIMISLGEQLARILRR